MFCPELLAAFSAARSLIANLKNDDSQEAAPIHELASELRELVVEAVDDWFSFGDSFEYDDILERANGICGRIERTLSPEQIVEAEVSDQTDGEPARSTDNKSPAPSHGIPPPEAKESSPDDVDALLVLCRRWDVNSNII